MVIDTFASQLKDEPLSLQVGSSGAIARSNEPRKGTNLDPLDGNVAVGCGKFSRVEHVTVIRLSKLAS
ncbi:hypothetical protein MesoLj113a_73550 [Mesorhizobium sp. 113-1-2]|nr:hypothetical protein MesoLj113a_73550 [Mesorhizobium sp. 113-1-2]